MRVEYSVSVPSVTRRSMMGKSRSGIDQESLVDQQFKNQQNITMKWTKRWLYSVCHRPR